MSLVSFSFAVAQAFARSLDPWPDLRPDCFGMMPVSGEADGNGDGDGEGGGEGKFDVPLIASVVRSWVL